MATQFKDGTWTQTLPFAEALADFVTAAHSGLARSFHVGTPAEIEAQKREAQERVDIKALMDRVSDLEAKGKPSLIVAPTFNEIQQFTQA
jgi:hypothetical protein